MSSFSGIFQNYCVDFASLVGLLFLLFFRKIQKEQETWQGC